MGSVTNDVLSGSSPDDAKQMSYKFSDDQISGQAVAAQPEPEQEAKPKSKAKKPVKKRARKTAPATAVQLSLICVSSEVVSKPVGGAGN